MKHLIRNFFYLSAGALLVLSSCSKKEEQSTGAPTVKEVTENGRTYKIVEGDDTKTREYTLPNGLKVFLSVNKAEPLVQTYIAVASGSRKDPATATGLAHYLEHMVFKGTSKMGTNNWEKEKPLLDSIQNLFEVYRNTKDPNERKKIYAQIDKVSGEAANYAIANEYDKVMAHLGARGTNAYTYVDQTVYTNVVPSNNLDRFFEVEAERFGELVPRLFHTELEAVYEEKNMGIDRDNSQAFEKLFENLYPAHPYGTQTTIGTIEHLKNPSIVEIKKYFDTWYVPNNMAICLSGDLDPEATLKMIESTFGKLPSKPLPTLEEIKITPLTERKEVTISGPQEAIVYIGFQSPSFSSQDKFKAILVDKILMNDAAGLFDQNIEQKQEALGVFTYQNFMKEAGFHVMGGKPKPGQTLRDLEKLMIAQIDSIKEGKFKDWLIPAIVANLKKEMMEANESNDARADAMVNAFVAATPWVDYVSTFYQLEKLKKEDIIAFVKTNYGPNYVAVYKEQGPKDLREKVEKPSITPVALNRELESEYLKSIKSRESQKLTPVFPDFAKEIQKGKVGDGIEVLAVKNTTNKLATLTYEWNMGKLADKRLPIAISYFEYLPSEKYTAAQFKEELYKIGTSYYVGSDNRKSFIALSGLDENMPQAMKLVEEHMSTLKADEAALTQLKENLLQERKDAKSRKGTILNAGLVNYVRHGAENPFTYVLKDEELKSLTSAELISMVNGLKSYKHEIQYYGPRDLSQVSASIKEIHSKGEGLKDAPANKEFNFLETNAPKVLTAHYDMVQADIVMLGKAGAYNPAKTSLATIFNEYFSGNMSSIVFQELRESKALAYSAYANYAQPTRKQDPNYVIGFIGTQNDKLPDALPAMEALFQKLPLDEGTFKNAINGLKEKIESERLPARELITTYKAMQELGQTESPMKALYASLSTITMNDVDSFHKANMSVPKQVLVVGDRNKINKKALSKYGTLEEINLQTLFGY